MSANTKIEWCDHTFNPWEGCTAVSPGCDHCYAEARNRRFGGGQAVNWGPGAPRRRTSKANWRHPLRWDRIAEINLSSWELASKVHGEAQLLERGFIKPRRPKVFCASLADVFDNEVPAQWRADLFDLITKTPNLDWLLLTKRIGNAKTMMADALHLQPKANRDGMIWLPPNVWIGVTVVNQAEADRDIPKLLAVPASKRFLSIEPMLGQIDLVKSKAVRYMCDTCAGGLSSSCIRSQPGPFVDWVICGGESGPQARPMHPDWARRLRDQCADAGVPFLFKQWGEFFPKSNHTGLTDRDVNPNLMIRIGKKAAGRLLDGSEHNEFPGEA